MTCNICLSDSHTAKVEELDLCVICKAKVAELKNA